MTYQQDANNFVMCHGIEKAERIADASYHYYSEKTSSYYSSNKNNSISIKHLKKAVIEYRKIQHTKNTLNNQVVIFRGLK